VDVPVAPVLEVVGLTKSYGAFTAVEESGRRAPAHPRHGAHRWL
jgi:hypothetical protein